MAEKTGGTAVEAGPATGVGQAEARRRPAAKQAWPKPSKTGGTAPLLDYLLGP